MEDPIKPKATLFFFSSTNVQFHFLKFDVFFILIFYALKFLFDYFFKLISINNLVKYDNIWVMRWLNGRYLFGT